MTENEKENYGCLGMILFIFIFLSILIGFKIHRAESKYESFVSDCDRKGGVVIYMRKSPDVCVPKGMVISKEY